MMAQPDFDSLHRALKNGEVAPVYYFYGAEDILKEDAIEAVLNRALDPAVRDFNYDQRTLSQQDPDSLHSLLNTLPMMAERRVVVLREVEGARRKAKLKAVLETYLKQPSPDTVLVMVQGAGEAKADAALARGAVAIEFAQLPVGRALRWINHYARNQKCELAPDAASHLLESVGNDLGMLRMELDKISSLAVPQPVTLEFVADIVGVRQGETLPGWRDHVMEGAVARALPMIGPLLNQPGMSGVKMVATLGSSLAGLATARLYFDRGLRNRALQQKVMAMLLSLRPFGLGDWRTESEKWARWAPGWPMEWIRKGVRAALQADQALKNTRISDEQAVVTDLVLQMTEHRWGEAA